MKRSINIISLKLVKDKSIEYKFSSAKEPRKVVELVKGVIGNTDREYVVVLNLNARLEPNSIEICGIGSLSQAVIYPREIFKSGIISNANSIVLVHTHPSGCVDPSPEDFLITKRIKSAGELLGIPLMDHLIIGNAEYFSFAEHGELH